MDLQPDQYTADKELARRVLQGDRQAFAAIVKNTEALVASIVCKMIPDLEARKDLAQDIYLKAYQHLGSFRFESKLSTWVAQIAFNTCRSWLEKKKLVLMDHDQLPVLEGRGTGNESAEAPLAGKQRSRILRAAMEQLPPLQKTLIALYHQDEKSYTDIAFITGLPEGTVKSYLFRARKALREILLSDYKREEI
ncbi:MAG: sigma-70 family RNA polymerase sigma factor [Bacteroidota bacterium]|nr:sigma-70 family RNA polymerase sigma factor [Bacteroidota bacterium]